MTAPTPPRAPKPLPIQVHVNADFSAVEAKLDEVLQRLAAIEAKVVGTNTKPSYSVKDAAKEIGVSTGMIYELIQQHKLFAVEIGARKIIPRASLDAYMRGDAPEQKAVERRLNTSSR